MSITKNRAELIKKLEESLKNQINEIIETKKIVNPNLDLTRNGYYTTEVPSLLGPVEIRIPRFRYVTFDYELLEANLLTAALNNLCVSLYGHGLSTRRISSSILEGFNINISKSKVSELCKVLQNDVSAYFATNLQTSDYEVIHIDAKYYRVKEVNPNRKSAVINAIGITSGGERQHIHMNVYKSEDKQYVDHFLQELKARIGDTNCCFVIDGNNNLASLITEYFPNAKVQRCLVHIVRNIEAKLKSITSIAECSKIKSELNDIFFYTANKDIQDKLESFLNKYSKYKTIFESLLKGKYVWTFIGLNMYVDCKTNNNIEGFHSQLEAVTSQHNSFDTKDSLYRALISEIKRYNECDSLAIERLNKSNLNFDISSILMTLTKEDLIHLKIMFNGRARVDEMITKEQYSEIRDIIQSE